MTEYAGDHILRIHGGTPLGGAVAASGSKNAALPMMAASILAEEPVYLVGVPQLTDVTTLARVLEELGLRVDRLPDGSVRIESEDPRPVRARYRWVRRMRAGFCLLGPLLARRRKAVVALPGGCNIGPRPVDLHLEGLAALGAELDLCGGYVHARVRQLRGATVCLEGPHGPTVTGTANVMCAAVLARGVTTIRGAALEPEIVDLGGLLNRMGARIEGLGSSTLRITGVAGVGGATYRVIPDRIEAATLLMAGAVSGGWVTVTGVVPGHLDAVLAGLRAAGFDIERAADRVTLRADGPPRPLEVAATPYPGIPTDLQAQWMALLCRATGRSTVCDRVFPTRLLHVAELNRLGARIRVDGTTAVIPGRARLRGGPVTATDLRASAALVVAGLAAGPTTTLHRAGHLDRGYEQLPEKLRRLGARIAPPGEAFSAWAPDRRRHSAGPR